MQDFLASELRLAFESGDEAAIKLAYLHYQQAMLQTLQNFQPCQEHCAYIDLTLLKKRINRLSTQTANYIATAEVLPMGRIQDLFKESRTLFGGVAQLCTTCRQTIRRTILENFRAIREQTSV